MIIFSEALLVKWRGISKDYLFNAVIDRKLLCFRYYEKFEDNWLRILGVRKWHEHNLYNSGFYPHDVFPTSIEEFFDSERPYYFLKDKIEAYEKEHPEVLKKPELETPKEAVPPYLNGNNGHFAPELALAIRLWESIAKGEFDSGKDSLSNFVEKYLKKELPGVKTSSEMIERFSTMISKQPKSLGKNGIEAVKGKFTPL